LGQLSLGMESGEVVRWLVEDGARVQAGQVVVEIETDKATAEVEAPAAGVLLIAADEGETLEVGGLLAEIDEGGN
jgi:pyruvate/2-oxoglutarate dehydrogenase complex dihydrolipoamide acyltransferase (E2) component